MDFNVVVIHVGTQTRKEAITYNTSVKVASFKKQVGTV